MSSQAQQISNLPPISVISDQQSDKQHLVQQSYSRYRDDLRRYIGKLLSSPEDIEEILQETFLRVTRHPPTEEKKAKSRAYLFVIAANLVKDRLRKRLSHSEQEHVSADHVSLYTDLPGPENLAVSEQLKNDLLRGLKGLNHKYCQVFVMHRFLHLSHQDIAKKLGVSVRTVERRISYTVDHFRAQLREHL